jgi:CTP synthase
MSTKYIFILGGVISGLGKGVISGSLCATLVEMGFQRDRITVKKLDPYLNVDPGTMNPIEHGEVYVTKDGAETDLDLGHYERLGGIDVGKNNSTSSGKILFKLLNAEREGKYLGKTVQLIPHFTNAIQEFIEQDHEKYDFVICEIGGSAGDYESSSFFETIRRMKLTNSENIMVCVVTYIVYYKITKEIKTKPTQVAIKQLLTSGIQPDLIFARTEHELDDSSRDKISLYTNIASENIIQILDADTIYNVPLQFHKENVSQCISKHFNSTPVPHPAPAFNKWIDLNKRMSNLKEIRYIAIIGKYVKLHDAYFSVVEALIHAGLYSGIQVKPMWVDARSKIPVIQQLELLARNNQLDGAIIPGGFGINATEEIINGIQYCRETRVPLLGICFGMQLAIIEYARNILGIKDATSSEFTSEGTIVVDTMVEWINEHGQRQKGNRRVFGGTMRLGEQAVQLKRGTKIYQLYEKTVIRERHRHRYEVNIKYKKQFEQAGMIFSGISIDNELPETIELDSKHHPYFVCSQYHPEFNSNPFEPNPLFIGLLEH